MKKIEVRSGMKVKVVGSANIRYQYGLENLTTSKIYNVITGYDEVIKDPGMYDFIPKFQVRCGINEFEIIDDLGKPCWASLTGLEDEPIFELVN